MDLHRDHARETTYPRLDVTAQLGAQGTPGDGQGQVHVDAAPIGHPHAPDHAEVDDVVTQLGVDDAAQGRDDGLVGRGRGGLGGHGVNSTGLDQ
jgi:hypothetical protein